jgi:hypothetical protein
LSPGAARRLGSDDAGVEAGEPEGGDRRDAQPSEQKNDSGCGNQHADDDHNAGAMPIGEAPCDGHCEGAEQACHAVQPDSAGCEGVWRSGNGERESDPGEVESEIPVERFVGDQDTVAIQMWAHFTAHRDDPESLFGAVETGTTFDFHGLIMHRLRADGRFQDIKVAYNKFIRTQRDGEVQDLGVPH